MIVFRRFRDDTACRDVTPGTADVGYYGVLDVGAAGVVEEPPHEDFLAIIAVVSFATMLIVFGRVAVCHDAAIAMVMVMVF